ncbi:MAG: hypothetical protein PHH48_07795 [Eubacteriales bacterium]|nr:hypothetical protein [Eubacteriales bacterium]
MDLETAKRMENDRVIIVLGQFPNENLIDVTDMTEIEAYEELEFRKRYVY